MYVCTICINMYYRHVCIYAWSTYVCIYAWFFRNFLLPLVVAWNVFRHEPQRTPSFALLRWTPLDELLCVSVPPHSIPSSVSSGTSMASCVSPGLIHSMAWSLLLWHLRWPEPFLCSTHNPTTDFVNLFKNPITNHYKRYKKDIKKIQKHIKTCQKCQKSIKTD